MAQLIFYDDTHSYVFNGKTLPSVSEILRFISRDEYTDVNQYRLDNAAERGSAVHKATEALDKYGKVEVDDAYTGYVSAYVKFLHEHTVEWFDIEKSMRHASREYAGTYDRFGLVDGIETLVDLKTTGVVKKTLVKAQLNGYEDMRISHNLTPAKQLLCVQLLDDGRYRQYSCKRDSTEFDACYILHMAIKKKHERGKIS